MIQSGQTDQLGRVMTKTYPVDSELNGMVKYEYDGNGNVTREYVKSNAAGASDKFDRTDYEYDSRNRLIMMRQFANSNGAYALPRVTQYYYDAAGNLYIHHMFCVHFCFSVLCFYQLCVILRMRKGACYLW